MIQQNASCDSAVHKACMEIAIRCTSIISPLLRQEEVGEALREFYIAARQVLDKPPAQPEI